jgi:hypothetical protein
VIESGSNFYCLIFILEANGIKIYSKQPVYGTMAKQGRREILCYSFQGFTKTHGTVHLRFYKDK